MLAQEFTFYDLDDHVYAKIESIVEQICSRAGVSDIGVILFEIITEIVQNAAKANFKEVLRHEIAADMNHSQEYETLMKNFKDRLPTAHYELAEKAKKLNLYIMLEATLSKSAILHLCVVNNRPASMEEMRRLDNKIVESKKYVKLADYYLKHYDDTEGAGLGTALIDISLRAIGYKNFLYRVFNDSSSRTVAELIIDLKEYVPVNNCI